MARKGGNQQRCRICNRLAGTDGFCKKHRPERKHEVFVRENFINDNFMTKNKEPIGDSYGAISDEFPCVRRGKEWK
jgi:hypothetical protein